MESELEELLTDLSMAGCGSGELNRARQLYESADRKALLASLRRCRCGLLEELHVSQRRVDRIDSIIRQTSAGSGLR